MRIGFAVLLVTAGLTYLIDFALRARAQGIQGGQAPSLILDKLITIIPLVP